MTSVAPDPPHDDFHLPHARLRAFQRVRGYCPSFVVRFSKAVIMRRQPEAELIGAMKEMRSLYRVHLPQGGLCFPIYHEPSTMIVTFLSQGAGIFLQRPRGHFLLHADHIERSEPLTRRDCADERD